MVPAVTIAFALMVHFVSADYSVAVRRNKNPRNSWKWEIYRPGKSMPVERSPDHFQTMAEATRAGKAALQRLVKLRLTLTLPI
jgi:hypothetical protein